MLEQTSKMKTTKISWADSTASPWYGCTKVSPGCANCYAEGWARRTGKDCWGPGKARIKSKSFERECRKWDKVATLACEIADFEHKLLAHRPRIFPSLCDWLDPEVPIDWLADALSVIHTCRNLDFLLLTKRPENFRQRMAEIPYAWGDGSFVPENIWVGASCENQEQADKRIPALLRIPAKVRFLSLEPLMGPVDLKLRTHPDYGWEPNDPDWVIVGGESGPNARPCNVDWIRSIVHQCKAAGVPCFVKQLGSRSYQSPDHDGGTGYELALNHTKGADPSEWPEDLRVQEEPK